MAKKVEAYIKLQVPAGQANPSPPVGPALGQHGVNIMEFCKAFNAETQGTEPGLPIPVVITVYSDRSFTFIKKTPPASVLLRKAAKIKKGSSTPNTNKVCGSSGLAALGFRFPAGLACVAGNWLIVKGFADGNALVRSSRIFWLREEGRSVFERAH